MYTTSQADKQQQQQNNDMQIMYASKYYIIIIGYEKVCTLNDLYNTLVRNKNHHTTKLLNMGLFSDWQSIPNRTICSYILII